MQTLTCSTCGKPFEVPDIPNGGKMPPSPYRVPHMDDQAPIRPYVAGDDPYYDAGMPLHYAEAELARWQDADGRIRWVWRVV